MKDIPMRRVSEVAIAVAPPENGDLAANWEVYLINLKHSPLRHVIVSSRGYGQFEDEEIKTSTLRHYFEEVAPLSCRLIEHIQPRVFPLNNEYWVSFSHDDFLFDQKFTFVAGAIADAFFTQIPLLERKGVMLGDSGEE